ncbi:hypothetical protein C5748_25170 [Phyllobacterium phragmitis]|uniref:Uncharacterized protein n=1 Tax=Phyllobacterium phragmitis TaxID=2670329 RepID=A0A2S9IJS3_9HYPH|nr:hypothetical protein [Phyllobacterium phragmitis]PRD40776.1 hypothetical protein C5748_25170 [Phyllobacterium phragmitis]
MHMMEQGKYSPEQRARLMELETSIRSEIVALNGGRIVTMGFPGLAFGVTGEMYIDPERMRSTLSHPSLKQCSLLVVLVELEELPEGGAIRASTRNRYEPGLQVDFNRYLQLFTSTQPLGVRHARYAACRHARRNARHR